MLASAPMLSVLTMLLAVASASDFALHRIPNALAVGVASTGLLAQLLAGYGMSSLAESVLAVAVVGAVVWPAWARGWIGGGDLKLAASTASWIGLGNVPTYLLASAVAVGVVSMACFAASTRAARAAIRRNLAAAASGVLIEVALDADNGRVQVPAGVGFAIGALATLAMTGGL